MKASRLIMMMLACFAFEPVATAETLEHKNTESYKLELGGFARTRVATEFSSHHAGTPSASLVMGRVMGRASYEELGQVEIELNVLGQPPLLDLFTDINLGSPFGLRVGLFKVPLSRELLLPIVSLPIYERTWLSQRLGLRRRVGAMAHGELQGDRLQVKVRSGVFNPQNQLQERFDQGVLLVNSVDLTWTPIHTALHLAYMDHMFKPTSLLDDQGEFVSFVKDRQVDLALYTEHAHLRALVEGLVSLDPDEAGHYSHALHGLLAYRLDQATTGYGFEPAVSVDYVDLDDGSHMRMTSNMHWLIRGRALQASLGYSFEPEWSQQPAAHYMLMELQGGF